MTISVLCESPRDRRPEEKCASKCVRCNVLSAFIYFLAQMDRGFEILFARFEIRRFIACVAEQQRHLTVNQADVMSFVGASPTTCTKDLLGRRLTGKPSDSKPEILGSNPGAPAKFGRWRAVARNWS